MRIAGYEAFFCDSIVFKKILKVSFRLKANWDFHSNFPKNIVTEGKIKSFDKVFWSNIAERKCTVFLYWSFQFETLKILFGAAPLTLCHFLCRMQLLRRQCQYHLFSTGLSHRSENLLGHPDQRYYFVMHAMCVKTWFVSWSGNNLGYYALSVLVQ